MGLVFLILVAVPGFYGVVFTLYAVSAARPGYKQPVIIEVHRGESPSELTQLLSAQGVISDPEKFIWLGKLARKWNKIKAGEYQVSPGMSPLEVFGVVTSGISIIHPVTVREGENMYEVAADLETKTLTTKQDFLALCRDPRFIDSLHLGIPLKMIEAHGALPSLEGYLYPDTYFFNRTMTATAMIQQMVRHFVKSWTPEQGARVKELGMSRYQIITLASMIEKETGASQERPLISSVFYNRLKKGMKLQSDPTTIYGMWDRFTGKIHRSNLREPNPYNTYTVPALPVGPISSPGKEAIQAALYPVQSDYLFFVSHNDGTHEFTMNLTDHLKAVKKYQLDPRAREGKSWRDLHKRAHAAPAPKE